MEYDKDLQAQVSLCQREEALIHASLQIEAKVQRF